MKNITSFNVQNKRVLVRCDFNVPQDENGEISDDFRIRESLGTIKYLIENQAKIILMSHFGDPEGQVVESLKLDKIAKRLSGYLGMDVLKLNDCVGQEVESAVQNLQPGQIALLENLRFHKEETDNDLEFAQKLASLGDIYINDAFSVCHRPHASIVGVPQILPHGAGLLLEEEIKNLDKIIESPQKPMVALIGGKKVETKSKVINKISKTADFVIISGLIKKEAEEKNIKFDFPEKIIGPTGDLSAMDTNQESVELFKEKILKAKTILWNGPFGKFEDEQFKTGSLAIARAIIESKAFSVVGGGETVDFLGKEGMLDKFSHVSTGGGAMLSYLAGDNLPGVEALKS